MQRRRERRPEKTMMRLREKGHEGRRFLRKRDNVAFFVKALRGFSLLERRIWNREGGGRP